MLIRREAAGDESAVAHAHGRAFPTPEGADAPVEVGLLENLRRSAAWLPRLSFVAVEDGMVVGHVVCTRAEVGAERRPALGLGPIGVSPEHQGRGVGSALMHTVLGAADACDELLVGVLGEPDYYRRFGFAPATDYGIEAPDPGWGDYFQVRLLAACPTDLRGPFRYAPPFGEL